MASQGRSGSRPGPCPVRWIHRACTLRRKCVSFEHSGQRLSPNTEHVQTEWSATHITLASAAALADAGELLLYRAADDIDRLAQAGESMSLEMRGRMRMDCSQGVRFALEAADKLYISSGGSGLSLKNQLQQVSRDLHAINMHGLLLHEASAEIYGRVMLGLEPNTIII